MFQPGFITAAVMGWLHRFSTLGRLARGMAGCLGGSASMYSPGLLFSFELFTSCIRLVGRDNAGGTTSAHRTRVGAEEHFL